MSTELEGTTDRMEEEETRTGDLPYTAGQWQLVWRRFKRHRLAMVAVGLLALMYLMAIFTEFIIPHDPWERNSQYLLAPPQRVRFYDQEEGFSLRPFVYPLESELDMETFQRTFTEDTSDPQPIYFFAETDEPYRMWRYFEFNRKLFGTEKGEVYLFGTDELGRCMFSRVIYGARISLTIGLVGVFMSMILGIILGSISGYFGGTIDDIIQRAIELFMSLPTIPLWMALAAAIPPEWSPVQMYFAITVILSIFGWTTMGRVVRGKLLSLREEEFVEASILAGASTRRIIGKHLLPLFASYIIVQMTLSIPHMILGETALSFLGIGLRPPAVSWGVLLQAAQDMQTVSLNPWLLLPAIFVIVTVLLFNFLGDGIRDAADPYG